MSSKQSRKEAKWGQVKFRPKKLKREPQLNVVARDARIVAPTPWSKYRENWTQNLDEATRKAKEPQIDSEEGQRCLRQRELNYRRIRMQQKQEEPIAWESFDDKPSERPSSTTTNSKSSNQKKRKARTRQEDKKKKARTWKEDKKKKKTITPPLIDQTLLDNFDARKLTFQQKDTIRRAVTKGVCLRAGVNLEQVVENMRYQAKMKRKSKHRARMQQAKNGK